MNLSDLTHGSDYIVQVRSYCDGEWTDWSDTLIFSTIPVTCFVPTDLTVSSIVPTGANLTWNQAGVSSAWFVEYGTSPDFSNATEVHVNDRFLHIDNLILNTTYYARVAKDCDTMGVSDWSDTLSFITTMALLDIGTCTMTKDNLPSHSAYM